MTTLKDVKIRNIKPSDKHSKHFDGGGLFLLVKPSGGKMWRLKYRFDGKEKTLAIGTYPEISLADARERRETARKQLAHGIDPGAVKKAQKYTETEETETFEVIAREWYGRFVSTWSKGHATNCLYHLIHSMLLEKDVCQDQVS